MFQAIPALAPLLQRPNLMREKILLIEDDPLDQYLIQEVLKRLHSPVDVQSVASGDEAQGFLARLMPYGPFPSVIFLDIKMPGMDGQKFYQALLQRRDPLCEHVLFVTGDVVAPRTQEFLNRHHLARVAKPFRMEELSGAVQRMLRRTKAMTAPRPNAKAKEA